MGDETVRGRGRPRHTFEAVKLLVATIREIFDEAAYSRFLKRERTERSCESYAAFLRENEIGMARRPRCC
jgi:hypothetical protein